MGQFVKENAHLKTDLKAYGENWDRIFKKKEERFPCEKCGEQDNINPSYCANCLWPITAQESK